MRITRVCVLHVHMQGTFSDCGTIFNAHVKQRTTDNRTHMRWILPKSDMLRTRKWTAVSSVISSDYFVTSPEVKAKRIGLRATLISSRPNWIVSRILHWCP